MKRQLIPYGLAALFTLLFVASGSPLSSDLCNATRPSSLVYSLDDIGADAEACPTVFACVEQYCDCIGAAPATEARPVRCAAFSNHSVIGCGTFGRCFAARHKCINNVALEGACEELSKLDQQLKLVSLSVLNYSEAPLLLGGCKADLCDEYERLFNAEKIGDCFISDLSNDICRFNFGASIVLNISGSLWASLLESRDVFEGIRAALRRDFESLFNVETRINSLLPGSLIVNASFQGEWTADLTAALSTASTSVEWLQATAAFYAARGGDPAGLFVTSVQSDAPPPPLTPPPQAPVFSKGSACSTGCIVGATVGSIVGVALIAVFALSLFMMRQPQRNTEPGTVGPPPTKTPHEIWVEETSIWEANFIVEYPNGVAIQYDRDGTFEFLRNVMKVSTTDIDFFKALSDRVLGRIRGQDIDASLVERTFAHKISKLLTPLSGPGITSEHQEAKDKHDLFTIKKALANLMDTSLVTFSGGDSNISWEKDIYPEHVALMRTMFECDSLERIERACYMEFTANEAHVFRKFLAKTVVHRKKEALDRNTFSMAYRETKGRDPSTHLLDRIFDYPNAEVPDSVFLSNMTTCAEATERCFAYDFTKSFMNEQLTRRNFWIYIIFAVLLIVQLTVGGNLSDGFYSQALVSNKVDGGFKDIALVEDTWEWITDELVPLIWANQADPVATHIGDNTFVVGALMLRTLRVSSEDAPELFDAFLSSPDLQQMQLARSLFGPAEGSLGRRYRDFTHTSESKSPFGLFFNLSVPEDVRLAFSHRSGSELNIADTLTGLQRQFDYPPDGFAIILPLTLTMNEALLHLATLRENHWVDRSTRMMVAQFFTFNRDTASVSRFRYLVELTPGGHAIPTRSIDVFTVFTRSSPMFGSTFIVFIILCPIMFFLFVLPLDVYQFLIGIPRAIMKQRQQRSIFFHLRYIFQFSLFDFWALLRFVNAGLFIASWTLRFWWLANTYESLDDKFYIIDRFPRQLDALAKRNRFYGYIVAMNVILTFTTLLYYGKLNHAISAVTNTFSRAARSLAGIALIYVIMAVAFALCAFVVYGNDIDYFSSFFRALATNGLVIIEIYELDEWSEVRRSFTSVYYTLYMVFMVLLLVNLIISVLMSAFESEIEEGFPEEDVQSLIVNDSNSPLLPPSLTDHVRSTAFLSFVRTLVLLAHYRLAQFIQWLERRSGRLDDECWVDPRFSYKEKSKEVWRHHSITFWEDMHRAVRRMSVGTCFDAYVGLAYIYYLRLPLHRGAVHRLRPPAQPVSSPSTNEPISPASGTVSAAGSPMMASPLTKVHNAQSLSLYRHIWKKFGDTTNACLTLLQEIPEYHLDSPTSVLIMNLLRHHWDWSKRISAYTNEEDDRSSEDMMREIITGTCDVEQRLERMLELGFAGRGSTAQNENSAEAQRKKLGSSKDKPPKLLHDDKTLVVNTFFVCPVSAIQRKKMTEFVEHEAARGRGPYTNAVPLQVFVDKWNELRIGSNSDNIQSFDWLSDETDFADVATVDDAGKLFLLTRIVDTLLSLGEKEFLRRKRQMLSLMWTTEMLMDFQQHVKEGVEKANISFDFEKDPFPYQPPAYTDDSTAHDVFGKAWEEVMKKHSYFPVLAAQKPPKYLQEAIAARQISYSHFCSYCTKDPSAHTTKTFAVYLAETMTQKGRDVFSVLWYILFLVILTYFVISARGLGHGIHVRNSIDSQFRDSFMEIDADTGLYDWLRSNLVERMFSAQDETAFTALPDGVNVPVGAIKIRNVRVRTEACGDELSAFAELSPTGDAALDLFYEQRVVSRFSSPCARKWCRFCRDKRSYGAAENPLVPPHLQQAFAHASCDELRGQGDLATPWHYYSCSGHALVIPLNYTREQARSDIDFLESNNWIDVQTHAVIIDAVFFNFNTRSLSRWRFGLEMPSGGGVVPTTDHVLVVPFVLDLHALSYLVFFSIYIVFVLGAFLSIFFELGHRFIVMRLVGADVILALYKAMTHDWWWVIRFIKCVLLIVAWSMRVALMARGNRNLNLGNANYVADNIEELAELQKKADMIDGIAVLTAYFLILYYFRMSPSLNVLIRTLQHATRHIISLVFVFYTVFAVFTMTGYVVYGNLIKEFSSYLLAQTYLFMTVLGIEADYLEMAQYHPIFSGVYYTAFLVTCLMILLNLIISVLGVAFDTASDEVYDSTRFFAIFDQDTVTAKQYSDGVSFLSWAIQVLFNELVLITRTIVYYATYLFSDRPTRLVRRAAFLHNPRHFWRHILLCLLSENPRRQYNTMLSLLGMKLNPIHATRTGEDDFGAAEDLTTSSQAGLQASASAFDSAPMLKQVSIDQFVTHSQVGQAFSESEIRVARLHEFMSDELGDHCDAALNLIHTATKVTGIDGKTGMESVLQAHHLFMFIAEQYTVASMSLEHSLRHFRGTLNIWSQLLDMKQLQVDNKALRELAREEELRRLKEEAERLAYADTHGVESKERVGVVHVTHGIFDGNVLRTRKDPSTKEIVGVIVKKDDGTEVEVHPSCIARRRQRRHVFEPPKAQQDEWFKNVFNSPKEQ